MTYPGSPPSFGHQTRDSEFAFKPGFLNLNGGSFGAAPKKVLDYVRTVTDEIEQNPDYFYRLGYQERLREVREKMATYIGARSEEVVIVGNATMGVNTVLRNFVWEQGDTLVSCESLKNVNSTAQPSLIPSSMEPVSTTYTSVDKTLQYLSDVSPFPLRRKIIQLMFPMTAEIIIRIFREFVAANPSIPGKKTVVVIDAIAAKPGVKLPWKELVAICNANKHQGFWSVIDAAHSLGQEPDLNLSLARPDFWVSNCYKWMTSKRCVSVLYVPLRNRYIIKSSIPTSAHYVSPPGDSFDDQFQCTVFSLIQHALEALKFREWMGGEDMIHDYCHNLAVKGGAVLSRILGTEVMDPDGSLTLSMVNVKLPFYEGPSVATIKLFTELMLKKNAYSVPFYHNGFWWTRCSAQIWNEMSDFENIGLIWLEVIEEVEKDPHRCKVPREPNVPGVTSWRDIKLKDNMIKL
ncbi:hypothetical protein H0H92_006416 [Tricholoma furcatifolium]|nr:hypothetical protein H0H92_006416 [Tricholoma furcatifolium]